MKFILCVLAGFVAIVASALAEHPFQLDKKSYELTKDFLNTRITKFDIRKASSSDAIQYLFLLANRESPKNQQGYIIKTDSDFKIIQDINLELNDISVYDALLELLSFSNMKVSFERGRFVFSPAKAQQDAAANP